MSRAAGTLVTTYNATYSAPSMLPGYGGHVPTVNFQYGETFGKASQKYFNDYRNEVLNSSKSLYSRGGYFPTSVSNNPELVINHRSRVRDMDLFAPKYELNNYNSDRTNELNQFYKKGQEHRYQYADRTGELHQVDHFVLPTSNEKMQESYESMTLGEKAEVNYAFSKNYMPPKGVKTLNEYRLFDDKN